MILASYAYISLTQRFVLVCLTLSAFTVVLALTMAKICTISDNESDASGDQEDTEHVEANQGAAASRSEHQLHVPQTSRGESLGLGLWGMYCSIHLGHILCI